MTKVFAKEQTDEMAQYRLDDLHYSFPELKPEDFANDDAYRVALLEQYRELRRQEFRYVVSNEAMKAYNVASEANADKCQRVENTVNGAWGGYGQKPDARDSSFVNVPGMVKVGGTPNQGQSCAISANALVLKISDEMGYTGKNNLIVPKSRLVTDKQGRAVGVSSKNNLSVAAYIHLQDSIPPEYRVSYTDKSNKPSLNEAIKQGIVGEGDEISLVTGKATNITSGCHAMVIVDVQKDASGKVVSYTLQGNNPPCLKTVNANSPDYYGKCPLNSAVRVSKWIDDKIYREIPDNMSSSELADKVVQAKEKVSIVTDRLHSTEAHYAEKKHYNDRVPVGRSDGFGEHYNEDLNSARAVAETKSKMKKEAKVQKDVASNQKNTSASATKDTASNPKQKVAESMKGSNGELAENKKGRKGATVAIKSGKVEVNVGKREAAQNLDKTDERTAKEAMKEDNQALNTASNDVRPNEPVSAQQTNEQPAQPRIGGIRFERISPDDEIYQKLKALQGEKNSENNIQNSQNEEQKSQNATKAPKKVKVMSVAEVQAYLNKRRQSQQ